jgi:predicted 3-demethylubiquinone-9 3-methyltransferase (glyoxalase superfamily)
MVNNGQKIVPHLWFDKEAKAAAEFYAKVFPESGVDNVTVIKDTPSGDCDVVSFRVWGYQMMAISAGPVFEINPSISFIINFDPGQNDRARNQLDEIWDKLIDGGKALMPLDKYPFSERYGWVEDKFGVSWQLILTDPKGDERQLIIPSLMFVTDSGETAEEATEYYLSVFKDSKRGLIARYPAGVGEGKEGAIMFTDFMLEKQWFAAMDARSQVHKFNFNEAISLMVYCEDQNEIDYYWEKLSAVPEAEQCGWLKDKFGVSWQIVPTQMDKMLQKGTAEQIARVTEAFLKMKKFNIVKLEKAYEGK